MKWAYIYELHGPAHAAPRHIHTMLVHANPVKPTVLLDYDGVVLRHPRASRLIRKRCERYTAMLTGGRAGSNAVRDLNHAVYTTFGHTHVGLRRLGYPSDIVSFNAQVYGDIDYNALFENTEDDVLEANVKVLKDVLRLAESYEVKIFSNAPREWCVETMRQVDMSGGAALAHMQSNFIDLSTTGLVKPDIRAYVAAEIALSWSSCASDGDIYFVDDALVNIAPVFARPGWKSVLFTGSNITLPSGLALVSSIDSLHDLIERATSIESVLTP